MLGSDIGRGTKGQSCATYVACVSGDALSKKKGTAAMCGSFVSQANVYIDAWNGRGVRIGLLA